jgi:hypothetical protein
MSVRFVVDADGEEVIEHRDSRILGDMEGVLLEALDFASTGREETAARAAVLTERGSHVSGFILRPDDGISDVAIVCNGSTRRLSPAEMQWLMHESHSPITMDVAGLREENRRLTRRLDEMTSLNMLQQAVVRELRAKARQEVVP